MHIKEFILFLFCPELLIFKQDFIKASSQRSKRLTSHIRRKSKCAVLEAKCFEEACQIAVGFMKDIKDINHFDHSQYSQVNTGNNKAGTEQCKGKNQQRKSEQTLQQYYLQIES